jgi:hypothetical protein
LGIVWDRAYRADTLLAMGSDLSEELDLMDGLIREHIKSYQVWFVPSPLSPPPLD